MIAPYRAPGLPGAVVDVGSALPDSSSGRSLMRRIIPSAMPVAPWALRFRGAVARPAVRCNYLQNDLLFINPARIASFFN